MAPSVRDASSASTAWQQLEERDFRSISLRQGSSVIRELQRAGLPTSDDVLAAVAHANPHVTDFRNIPPGTTLRLPNTQPDEALGGQSPWEAHQSLWQAAFTELTNDDFVLVEADKRGMRVRDYVAERGGRMPQTHAPGAGVSTPTAPSSGTKPQPAPSAPRVDAPSPVASQTPSLTPERQNELMDELHLLLTARSAVGRGSHAQTLTPELAKLSEDEKDRRMFTALHTLARALPNVEVEAKFAARFGGAKVRDLIAARLDGRERAHALAYLNNESGTLEEHDLFHFLAHGWNDRLLGGLGTADDSMKQLVQAVGPDNREAINDKLRKLYGYEGKDPISDILKGEFSGKTERELVATTFMARAPSGAIAPEYKLAFELSEAKGEDLMRLLDAHVGIDFGALRAAFADLHAKGVLPKAAAKDFDGHLRARLDAAQRATAQKLDGFAGLAPAELKEREAAYVNARLEALLSRSDEEGIATLLGKLIGDGTDGPSFAQVAAAGPVGLGTRILSKLDGEQEALATLIIDGEPPSSPRVLAHRIARMEGDELSATLDRLNGHQMAAVHAAIASDPSLDLAKVRAHVAQEAGAFLDDAKKVPSRALALFDRGSAAAIKASYPEGFFAVDPQGGVVLAPASEMLYAIQDKGFWIFARPDKARLTGLTRRLSDVGRAGLPEQYAKLAALTADARPLRERLFDSMSDTDAAEVWQSLQPRVVGTDAAATANQIDTLVANMEAELKRGMPAVLGQFDMERGLFEERLMEFKVEVRGILEAAQARAQAGEPFALTDAERGQIRFAIEKLTNSLKPFLDERAATAEGLRTAGIYIGATVGIAVAVLGSGFTGGASLAAVPQLTLIIAGAAGGIAGATLGDATDGLDVSSPEFLLDDVISGGMQGASLGMGMGLGAKLAANPAAGLSPATMRALPWVAKAENATHWTGKLGYTFYQAARVGGLPAALAGAGSGVRAYGEEQFLAATGDMLFEASKSFAIGTAVMMPFAFRSAAALSAARPAVGASQNAENAAVLDRARKRVSDTWREVGRWQQEAAGSIKDREQALVSTLKRYGAASRGERIGGYNGVQKHLFENHARSVMQEQLKGSANAAQLVTDSQMTVATMWEAGIETPSKKTQEMLTKVFNELAKARGIEGPGQPRMLDTWLASRGFSDGSLTERVYLTLSRDFGQSLDDLARQSVSQSAKTATQKVGAARIARTSVSKTTTETVRSTATPKATVDRAAEEVAAKKVAEEAAVKKAAQEAAAKKLAEEAAVKKAAQEAATKKLAEEAAVKKAAQEAAAKKLAEEAAVKKAAQEAAAKKLAEEAAVKKAAQEAAAKKVAEEAAVKKAAEEAAVKKAAQEAAAKKVAEEAAVKKAAQEAAIKKAAEQAAVEKAATQRVAAAATSVDAKLADKLDDIEQAIARKTPDTRLVTRLEELAERRVQLGNLAQGTKSAEAAGRIARTTEQLTAEIGKTEGRLATQLQSASRALETGAAQNIDKAQAPLQDLVTKLQSLRGMSTSGRASEQLVRAVDDANKAVRGIIGRYETQLAGAVKSGVPSEELRLQIHALRELGTKNPGLFDDVTMAQLKGAVQSFEPQVQLDVARSFKELGEYTRWVQKEAASYRASLDGAARQVSELARTDPKEALNLYRKLVLDKSAQLATPPRRFFHSTHAYTAMRTVQARHAGQIRLNLPGMRSIEQQLAPYVEQLSDDELMALRNAIERTPTGVGDVLMSRVKDHLVGRGLEPLTKWNRYARGMAYSAVTGTATTMGSAAIGFSMMYSVGPYMNPGMNPMLNQNAIPIRDPKTGEITGYRAATTEEIQQGADRGQEIARQIQQSLDRGEVPDVNALIQGANGTTPSPQTPSRAVPQDSPEQGGAQQGYYQIPQDQIPQNYVPLYDQQTGEYVGARPMTEDEVQQNVDLGMDMAMRLMQQMQ